MSKLKFLIGSVAVFAVAFAMSASAACDFGTMTLRVGSKGEAVMAVQTVVGATADGSFGPMTAAKVKVWQAANGLTADGVVGAMSKAKMGMACGTTTTTTTTTLPAGCQVGWAFNPATGASCAGSTTVVSGGAGDVSVDSSTKSVKATLKEGEENVKVLGYKLEATDSDINVSNVKVWLENDASTGASSEKLSHYIDSVQVYLGDKEVGSADAADFTKTAETWDTFTKSISLSGAVVKEGDIAYLYVAVSAVSNIDTSDEAANWNIALTSMRYTDGTGAIMSADVTTIAAGDMTGAANVAISAVADHYENFAFSTAASDDKLTIKSSTANPAAATVQVNASDTTDDVLIGAFKLNVDQDSSDITITEIPVILTFTANEVANTANATDWAGDVIDSLYVKIDGTEYPADLATSDDATLDTGAGTATYRVAIDSGDLVIAADDTVEAKVYANFAEQGGTASDAIYSTGTTVTASVADNSIEAEGADELDNTARAGSFAGKTQTLEVNAASVALVSTPKLAISSAVESGADIYLAKFIFKVTAPEDQEIYLPLDTFPYATAGTAGVQYDVTGGAVVKSAVLEATDDSIAQDHSYLIEAGTTEEFTFSVYLAGNDANGKVTMTSVWYEESEPTTTDANATTGINGTPEITSGMSSFKTSTVFLSI